MKKIILFILPVFFFLNYSCKQENPAIRVGNDFLSTNKKDHFIVTSLGDSIQSGVPLRGKGKVIDPNSVSAAKMLAVGGPPAEAPIQINVKPLGQPQTITPPKNPRVFIIGEDGIPLAKTVPALGESVRAIQPPRKIAGKPLIKHEAITNIQIWNLDQGLNASSVKKMLKDSRSDIWMITDGGGISRFDGNYFTHYTINEGLPFNDPICMMEDSHGNIWIGGFQGLVRYDGNRFTHYTQKDGLEDVVIYAMMEDKNGSLWFAGHGHLTRFDPDQNTFTHFNTDHGFTQNLPIRAMKEDSHGNIWIGQVWGGFYLFEPSNDGKGGKISHFGDEQGFGEMFFSSILENKDGEVWIGTSSGVYQMNITSKGINKIKRYTMDQGLTDHSIFSMVQDRHGDIWLGTRNGLNSMHIANEDIESGSNGTITSITEEQGLSDNRVTSLLEDDHGNIWIGTRNGLNRYMEGRFSYIRNAELSDYPIHTILEDQQGHLWFGSSNTTATLFKLEENIHDGQLQHNLALFSQYKKLGMPDVQSISADAKGRLWVGVV